MKNLTGNAKDLWIAGIRDIENQIQILDDILLKPKVTQDNKLVTQIEKAKSSTNEFVNWLKQQALKKTGPSGI